MRNFFLRKVTQWEILRASPPFFYLQIFLNWHIFKFWTATDKAFRSISKVSSDNASAIDWHTFEYNLNTYSGSPNAAKMLSSMCDRINDYTSKLWLDDIHCRLRTFIFILPDPKYWFASFKNLIWMRNHVVVSYQLYLLL